jgi:hypothetical protein
MNQEIPEHPASTPRRVPRVRAGAVVALAVVAGVVAWLALRGGNDSSKQPTRLSGAVAASVSQLSNVAASVDHPIFWLGPKKGYTYELLETRSGKVYIRYLPAGVPVGTNEPYLTVATYPFSGAYAALDKAKNATRVKLAHDGLAVLDSAYPKSVHVAYPGVDYQVEVFDPTPQRAFSLVSSGQLAFFGRLAGAPGKPVAESQAQLEAFAKSLGHPIYWAGPRPGFTYELTQTSNGSVYVRYLPRGVKVGVSKPYLTVVTYPYPHALNALKRTIKGNTSLVTSLGRGGIAVVDSSYPKSVHIAYPSVNYQVEVFHPSPTVARRVATSGKIRQIG